MKLVITESQLEKLVNEELEISEIRNSFLNHVVNKTEELTGQKWPIYVLKDWLYRNTKDFRTDKETENSYKKLVTTYVKNWINVYGTGHWELNEINITTDVFEPSTKKDIMSRMGNNDRQDIPNDLKRHQTQQTLIKSLGISKEPVIVVKTSNGYDLIEGWHRTIQSLKEFGSYKQMAYIYVPDNNLNEELLTELGNISDEVRIWTTELEPVIFNSRLKKMTISGRQFPEAYELFPIDVFIIEKTMVTGAFYDEQKSGFKEDGKYVVHMNLPKIKLRYALNHELRHAFEDYMRKVKNKPGLSQSKEGSQYFSGDFTNLMMGKIEGEFGIFRGYMKALYLTSKIEESAYSESVYDRQDWILKELEYVKKITVESKSVDPEILESNWNELKEKVNIPIIQKFNTYVDFMKWADKQIEIRYNKVMKKLLKIKYMRDTD
jgi:hypothetical protein